MHQPIILAAGDGSRWRTNPPVPKPLREVAGMPMLGRIVGTLHELHFHYASPIVVVGFEADQIKAKYPELAYATQKVRNGTAKAVELAIKHVANRYVVVLYGDNPFVRRETLELVARILNSDKPTLLIGTVEVPNFEGRLKPFESFGRVVCDEVGLLMKMVEHKDLTESERDIKLLNAGLCAVERRWLEKALHRIDPSKNGEYYLTSLLELAYNEGRDVAQVEMGLEEAFGVNSQQDKEYLEDLIKEKV